ncbi:hypothetical protein SAMN04488100_11138 [Alkalibacterium putridalgicola]|uniref:Type IV pilus assembly protein PilN n=1 Tax=Alkalibacterium putridalgicola TaxID=426703 RepID=A0A1H7T865_9LACT|nr:hypothetical protein [Alkalibacterium putridalgicola]GEK89320.1 hypothetical protein APU01nite_13590 [Alkalibacterium putridalgicola]SEL80908.1 hypothetical protein SAMN04488100_11138 [Alkalibacterium putridalgicola]
MIDINFFEKKQVNILPYILGGVFFLLLVLMGTYFYMTHSYYTGVQEDSNQWIQANGQDVALSRRIESVDRLADQSAGVQELLTDSQYPMGFVTDDIASVIPNETEQVSALQLTEANQIVLLLENTTVEEASSIITNFETLDYIERVQLLRLENQQNESNQFSFEMTLDLNEDVLREVAGK